MIQLDPLSLSIGYVAGTLLCWYLRDTLDAKESEYEQEEQEELDNFHNRTVHGNYPYNLSTSDRRIM